MRVYLRRFLGLALLMFASASQAADPLVFPVFNQAALARQHVLPSPAGGQANAGTRLQLDWTSEMVLETRGGEQLRLDGETLRLGWAQSWRRGNWLWSAELPLLVTGGGVLDGGIEQWHEWFGLPNGGREKVPRNDYRYTYVRGGATVFDVHRSGARLGDLRLGGAVCRAQQRGCLHLSLQLPTGDAQRLEGGGLGAAGWYEQGFRWGAQARWSGVLGGGLSATRVDGPLQDQAETVVPFGWLALGYGLSERLDVGVQAYAHGPLYDDSRLDALTREGVQLAFGLRYAAASRWSWTLAMQEDLVTASSPDFSIHIGLQWR